MCKECHNTKTNCAHPSHKGTRRVDIHSRYVYTDSENGITERHVCRTCYAAHILKYYPNSQIAEHIRHNPNDYKNTYTMKRK